MGVSARERAAPGILGPCAAYVHVRCSEKLSLRESRFANYCELMLISLIAFLAALSTRSFIRLAYRPYRPSRSPSIRPPVSTGIWWKGHLADGSPLRSRLPHMLFTPFACGNRGDHPFTLPCTVLKRTFGLYAALPPLPLPAAAIWVHSAVVVLWLLAPAPLPRHPGLIPTASAAGGADVGHPER